jgi:hypothetical protein
MEEESIIKESCVVGEIGNRSAVCAELDIGGHKLVSDSLNQLV